MMTTRSWDCECGATVCGSRYTSEVECTSCDQPYNAFGQRLRRNWIDNPSNWDEDITDLDGYEMTRAEH